MHRRPRNPQIQGQIKKANPTKKRGLGNKLDGRQSHRLIDINDDISHTCNVTIHSATKPAPFLLFHSQNGFNNPQHIENLDDDVAKPPITNEKNNKLNDKKN